MKRDNATKVRRKSGGAQWRDLLFLNHSIESERKRCRTLCHPDRSGGICSSTDPPWKCFRPRINHYSLAGSTFLRLNDCRTVFKITYDTGIKIKFSTVETEC
jgi:hypothetical protein